jgi:hypothetical protein
VPSRIMEQCDGSGLSVYSQGGRRMIFRGFIGLMKERVVGCEWDDFARAWQAAEPDQLPEFVRKIGKKSEGLEGHCQPDMLCLREI